MAKSVLKKKKTNRRLKKSVRRTLGALCMITAIIVAAIPFPDAAADDGTAAASGTEDPSGYPYSYDVDTKSVDDGGDYLVITDSMNEGADIIDTSVNYYKYKYDETGNVTAEQNGDYRGYFWNMDLMRKYAQEKEIPFWVFIQAGSQWYVTAKDSIKPYFPNEPQLHWNINTCLADAIALFQCVKITVTGRHTDYIGDTCRITAGSTHPYHIMISPLDIYRMVIT
mgnify:CR=1 FL=1